MCNGRNYCHVWRRQFRLALNCFYRLSLPESQARIPQETIGTVKIEDSKRILNINHGNAESLLNPLLWPSLICNKILLSRTRFYIGRRYSSSCISPRFWGPRITVPTLKDYLHSGGAIPGSVHMGRKDLLVCRRSWKYAVQRTNSLHWIRRQERAFTQSHQSGTSSSSQPMPNHRSESWRVLIPEQWRPNEGDIIWEHDKSTGHARPIPSHRRLRYVKNHPLAVPN